MKSFSVIWCQPDYVPCRTSPPLTSPQCWSLLRDSPFSLNHGWSQGPSPTPLHSLLSLLTPWLHIHNYREQAFFREWWKKVRKMQNVALKCGPGRGCGIMKWSILQIVQPKWSFRIRAAVLSCSLSFFLVQRASPQSKLYIKDKSLESLQNAWFCPCIFINHVEYKWGIWLYYFFFNFTYIYHWNLYNCYHYYL